MRIHPRYFNRFMVVVAVVATILIVIATMNYISGREDAFQRQMMEADSLGYVKLPYVSGDDSLQLNQFQGQYLLLDFWSIWSDPSQQSHKQLSGTSWDSLAVVAASVRTDSSEVLAYRRTTHYPFEFVDGTAFYEHWNLPGVPSQVLFNPKGEVVATFVGYTDSTHYDSLKTLIQYE